MNRISKPANSEIITRGIVYKEGGDNSGLREILIREQKNVCAYTQARVTEAFSVDTEHFNPTLKNTDDDNYNNWFAVSTKWNRQKRSVEKWNEYQEILHPTDEEFEKRIIYKNGVYEWNEGDDEARHLIEYLNLNQENLVRDRKSHLKTLQLLLEKFGNDTEQLRNYLETEDPNQIQYIRAIQEELGITF